MIYNLITLIYKLIVYIHLQLHFISDLIASLTYNKPVNKKLIKESKYYERTKRNE